MWGSARSVPALALAFLVSTAGCGGGGGSGGGIQPPPPHPDFAIFFSAASLTLVQGNSASAVTISILVENGFSGTIQVTLAGLPTGTSTTPASPFSIAAGQNSQVLIGAASDAATGQFSATAQGSSGALTHSANLSLTVQASAPSNLPRTSFVRNDSVMALDNPLGEPHRRHIAYDPAGKRFFVANRAMNRVEVLTGASPSPQTSIDVPGATSVDLAADCHNLGGGGRFSHCEWQDGSPGDRGHRQNSPAR